MQMYTGTRLTMAIHRRHSFLFFSEGREEGICTQATCEPGLLQDRFDS